MHTKHNVLIIVHITSTYMHSHTRAHSYNCHTHIHTHIHTRMHTRTHAHTHTHTHTHTVITIYIHSLLTHRGDDCWEILLQGHTDPACTGHHQERGRRGRHNHWCDSWSNITVNHKLSEAWGKVIRYITIMTYVYNNATCVHYYSMLHCWLTFVIVFTYNLLAVLFV